MRAATTLTGAAICLALALVVVLDAPGLSAGWRWDAANLLGFGAFAGMLLLQLHTGARSGVKSHERLSWFVVALLATHVLWLLFDDPTTIEYLKLKSPPYMLSGLVATALLLVLVFSALPFFRKRLFSRWSSFRWLHWWLGWVCVGLAAHHILGSGFYASGLTGGVALLIVTGAIFLLARRRPLDIAFPVVPVLVVGAGLLMLVLAGGAALRQVQVESSAALPLTFSHAAHEATGCLVCHHNFADGTGSGFCVACHKEDPLLNPHIEAHFHGLCRDCHVAERLADEPAGPVRQCEACHSPDTLP